MSTFAECFARTCPELSALFLPSVESWRCALCSAGDLRGFGIIGVTAFSARRFGGRGGRVADPAAIVYFVCAEHTGTPKPEVEDEIARELEDEPGVPGLRLYLARPSRPRPV